MAKQVGFLKVKGTYDDVSFFKRGDAFFMRQKGGVSKERLLNDPAFARTRENISEFGTVARAGKLFRNAAGVMVRKAYDKRLNNRVIQALTAVKKADATSLRGQRQISVGFATPAGKAAFTKFDLNGNCTLGMLLTCPYDFDSGSGTCTIANLVPGQHLLPPPHATHVSFQVAAMRLDFDTELDEMAYSPVETLPLNMTPSTVVLTPTSIPGGRGALFFMLLVEFLQELNGTQYALNQGTYNSLTVLEVV